MKIQHASRGFTLVELLVIIVVVSIIVGVTVGSYGAWQTRSAQNTVKSDVIQASTSMKSARNFSSNGMFPTTLPYTASPNVTLTTNVAGDGSGFCVIGQSTKISSVNFYMNSKSSNPVAGTSCTVS